MKTHIIRALAELNTAFYRTVAIEFDQTRRTGWNGWERLLLYLVPLFDQHKDSVTLDLGCGNGRFGQFLSQHLDTQNSTYVGIDNNEVLLQKAQQNLNSTFNTIILLEKDLIEALLNDTLIETTKQPVFDLIVSFGVLHHVPSFELRQNLIKVLAQGLKKDGLLVVSCWQFLRSDRLKERLVEPVEISISPDELETNDYFLDWQRGDRAIRYCHAIDPKEIDEWLKGSKLELVDKYDADGQNNNLNTYLVIRKKE